MGMSFYYNDDDVSLQAGLGVGSNYTGWNVSGRVGDFSMGFGQTTYDAGTFHGTEISSQRIGTISASYKGATFSISNDLWGDKKDRWRSSAAELTIGRFSFGTYVDTSWGHGPEKGGNPRYDGKDPIIGYNDYDPENIKTGAWVVGKVYSSPFWVGYNDRGTVHRYGFNHPYVQSLTQNFVHKYVSKTPFFLDYSNYHYNVYSSWGRKNNFDMWGY